MSVKNITEIMQVLPEQRSVPLENLYLDQNIRAESDRIGRPIIYTNYMCDLDDVIAIKDENGVFRVPKALKNPDDWRLFQELEAQADVIISSRAYLNRLSVLGERAQNILTEFEPGGEFEDLGTWRLKKGFPSRSPDIAIIGREPDILVPDSLLRSSRTIIYFTRYDLAGSPEGKKLEDLGIAVVGAGDTGVDGKRVIDYLAAGRNYRTICMLSGPGILSILLDAEALDRLYLTRVRRKIPVADPSSVIRLRYRGIEVTELPGFTLSKRYLQKKVITADGFVTSEEFLVYEKTTCPARP